MRRGFPARSSELSEPVLVFNGRLNQRRDGPELPICFLSGIRTPQWPNEEFTAAPCETNLSSFPPLCHPSFSQIMRLIVSVSPCPLVFHLSAAFMVSLRARTQSAFLNVCGFYKGSSYIKGRKNDRAELWGLRTNTWSRRCCKDETRKTAGGRRRKRNNGATLRADKVIVKLQTTHTNDGFRLIWCIWWMM